MYPFIISKLTSGIVFMIEKSKNIDGKKAMLIAIPFGIGGGVIATILF